VSAISFRPLVGLPRRGREPSESPAAYTARETLLLLIAALAVTGGLIHIGAGVDHFQEYPPYTVAFTILAGTQIGWAAMIVRRPSDRLLLFGCVFNLAIIALWVASRTVGVPIAPQPWVPEAIGVADAIETVGEIVVVFALLCLLMSARHAWARAATRFMAPLLLFTLLICVLYGSGAHAG
jgi:hypothetical protein